MEQRLSQIVCHAFDECTSCESMFKLFEMMGSLLERPIIQRDFRFKYPVLLTEYNKELDQAKMIFDSQMERVQGPSGAIINKNMPHVAGVLKWSQELRERVSGNMDRLKLINHG